jgi:protein involved in polysaccharide export with SLBB domain
MTNLWMLPQRHRIFLSLGLFMALNLAIVSELNAQDFFYRKSLTNLRIDQLSQDQVISFQRYVQAKGMSETEASNYLLQKGLSRAEVDKLRKRSGGLSNTNAGSVAGNFEMMDQYFKLRDSLQALAVDTAYPKVVKDHALIRAKQVPDSVIFGSELFAGARLRFNLEGQMVPPLDYRVGPGDVLSILIYGFQEASFELKVQANGKITMPYAGLITVAGLTLDQVSEKLKQNLQTNGYSKLATGQTKLHVGMADFRQIQVTMVGSTQPGNFMVPSVAKLFHVMHVAGGPSSRSTYRNVELWRNGKLLTTVDLYKLLSGGDFEGNINLQDHDVVYFPPYFRRIMVRGEIRRPALFETKVGEKFRDILAHAGGFTAFAYTKRVWVERVMDGEMRYLTFEGDSLMGFEPQDGDIITVQSISEKKKGLIQLSGAVKRPGDYAHYSGMRLSHLLLQAEALEPTAILSRAMIVHRTPDGIRRHQHFDLDSVKTGLLDPDLLDGDSVIVGSVIDFYPRLPVRVMGEVHKEISIPWGPGMTAQDAVFMAGGFKPGFAVDQWIKIARRVELDSLDGQWEIAKVIREATDSLLMVRASETLLEEGDVVMVYRDPTYLPLAMVRVEGSFNSPGLFPVRTKSEKIKDLIGRAGGFNPFADKRSLMLIRNHEIPMVDLHEDARANDAIDISAMESTGKVRVVRTDTIALDWNTLNSGGKKGNFLLKDGDRLVVDEKSEIVLVQGSVNSQVMLNYGGHRMRTYLAGAGGLSESGDPSRIYVRRTNGKMASTKRVLGIITRYPKVYPGDMVVVPIKAPKDDQDQGFDSGKWMAISGVLMSMATMATVVINSFK